MKIRSKCVGVGGVCRGEWRDGRGPAHTGPAYMSMATMTLVRAAMTHAVTNM